MLENKIDLNKLKKYIELGLVSESEHSERPEIKIYNYTPECQFDRKWDEVTKICRGLIVNTETGEILARPFEKFFNIQEHLEVLKLPLPNEDPNITEKVDGSLGILYWLNDEPWIATRGSFTSDQSIWATDWFRKNVKYSDLPKDLTLLFEIIYKENRIVVNYDFEGLVFIAAIDTKTGRQVGYKPEGVRTVRQIPNTDILELAKLNEKEGEGFVVFYPKNNLRVKIKFPEYVRLHKILTGLSIKGIWEYLKENGVDADIKKIVEDAPDEFYVWMDSVTNEFKKQYKEIEYQCETDFNLISYNLIDNQDKTRKDWAIEILKRKYPGILFAILDSKKYDEQIWKILKPKGSKTFKDDIDI